MRTAIVMTVRTWSRETNSWVRYHRAIGFDRLYIYIDDGVAPVDVEASVAVTACDRAYWAGFAVGSPLRDRLDVAGSWGTSTWSTPQYVMLRQCLNAQHALIRAVRDGVTWMLHIDADELFFDDASSVGEHFSRLEQLGIVQARYMNHEAVVDRDCDEDYFTALTLFRTNRSALDRAGHDLAAAELRERPYFLSYTNGKSAVRVRPDVTVRGVHAFDLPTGDVGQCVLAAPSILHYPYSSARRFIAKHRALGLFDASNIFDVPWRPPGLLSAAQLYVQQQDDDGLQHLFDAQVRWHDEASLHRLEHAGVFRRITQPSLLLDRLGAR